MNPTLSYKIIADRLDYLELQAPSLRLIQMIFGIAIFIALLIILVVVIRLGFFKEAAFMQKTSVAFAFSLGILISLLLVIFLPADKIIVDGQREIITIGEKAIPFKDIEKIELHTEMRTGNVDTSGAGGAYYTATRDVRVWNAVLVTRNKIPITSKIPWFMLKKSARNETMSDTFGIFQVQRPTYTNVEKAELEAHIAERPTIPEFYDLVDKIAKISKLKVDNQILADFGKEQKD